MNRRQLLRYYAGAAVVSVVVFTVAYDTGMSVFEDRPRTLLESFEIVLQTFTTTGYGQDAPWSSPVMTLLVVSMQVASLVLIFAAFPIVIVPLVEDALSTTAPTERPDLSGHVVVCAHSNRTSTLVDEFERRSIPYVIVERDRETAADLHEAGRTAVHGDPESTRVLERVGLADARALVADGDDQADLSVVMAAGEVAPSVPAYTVLEDDDLARYHDHAGADRVFSPRELLGRGLANKVRTAVDADFDGAVPLDGSSSLRVAELSVRPGSALLGRRLSATGLDERAGLTVVGAWTRGEFRAPPPSDLTLDAHTVLLLVGRPTAIEAVDRSVDGPLRRRRGRSRTRGDVIVAGYGVVGSTVVEALSGAETPRVVDLEPEPAVDVAGDATDPETLREAGVPDAETVVIALDDDATALLATFVVRDLAPEAEVVVRAEEADSVQKLYRAGADYVLSLASVTGRLLAAAILDDRDAVAVDEAVAVAHLPAGPLAGRDLGEVPLAAAGCSVVAIERRDGRLDANLGRATALGEYDRLVVAGLASDVRRLREAVAAGEWPDGDAAR